MRDQRVALKYTITIGVLLVLLLWMASRTFGQATAAVHQGPAGAERPRPEKQAPLQPAFTEYRGIKIGLTAGEVRDLIGRKPKTEDDSGYLYVFSDQETAQVVFDENEKVRLIAVTYLGKSAGAPTYEAVFGKDVPLKTTPDGRTYNMVSYPDAGYWVAYSSLGPSAEDPLVSITVQRIGN